ncbi:MAG: hypothetical protein JWN34_3624 [Bryobacterales bacterium]|nr:hypothetical protein [Bryobacterales bacterium]
MVQMPNRPKRGLDLPSAMENWSDPKQYAKLVAVSGEAEPPSEGQAANYVREKAALKTYIALRMQVDRDFIGRLIDAELIGSGIPSDGSGRMPIDPSLWDVLEIDYELFEAVGPHHLFTNLEFFEPAVLPTNIRHVPGWLDDLRGLKGYNVFRYTEDYRNIWLNGMEFLLSDLWSKMVRILHTAYLKDGIGWRPGKRVLEEAGSAQSKMSDVLKSREDHEAIIKSDGKGRYCLAISLSQPSGGD